MSTTLDLDDVAAGHPRALEELAELRKDAARYETARRMTPRQFQDAFTLNIITGKPFDEIIDELAELRKEAARYRWLRECPTEMALRFGHVAPGHWDDQIDRAMAKKRPD